jgi:photosynthetic reaction center cytochrome c subunit
MSQVFRLRFGAAMLALAAASLLAGCERPPMESKQLGYRGTGMQQVDNPRLAATRAAAQAPIPPDTPPVPADGPKARDVYQNVKVLGDLSVAEFTRHMAAITQWVAPTEGCGYCHDLANLATDTKYTKVVARRMIEMTQHLNGNWTKHVGQTGVTCYTCHRGQTVPERTWTLIGPNLRAKPGSLIGNDFGQNKATAHVGYTSLPYDPYSPFLLGKQNVRVNAQQALPGRGPEAHKVSIQATEQTYALMMVFSESLGVNCTYCHNSHSFITWESPARVTAWHGIRMARELNNDYLVPLTATLPASRLGPMGDVKKVYCATCHQGANKPLGGAQMAMKYVGLMAPAAKVVALPPPRSEPRLSVLYFDVGSPVLQGTQAKGLDQLVATMLKEPRAVAAISGYHSAAGTLAANQELAKQRAFTVRDAMLAAGVAERRVRLERPQETAGNVAGEDPTSRRVEVRLQ